MTRHVEPPPRTADFTSSRGTEEAVLRSTELRAQSEFDEERWMQSFRKYLVDRNGFDLRAVVRVGVGRAQST